MNTPNVAPSVPRHAEFWMLDVPERAFVEQLFHESHHPALMTWKLISMALKPRHIVVYGPGTVGPGLPIASSPILDAIKSTWFQVLVKKCLKHGSGEGPNMLGVIDDDIEPGGASI